jgi:hypothetical protein
MDRRRLDGRRLGQVTVLVPSPVLVAAPVPVGGPS